MKSFLLAVLFILVWTTAFATLDPRDNCLGMYVDPYGNEWCGTANQSLVYVILTNSTFPEIRGVEFGFDVVGGPVHILSMTWPPQALAIGGFEGVRGDWSVGFEPIPTTEATVLCEMNVLPLGPAGLNIGPNTLPSADPSLPSILDENGDVQPVGIAETPSDPMSAPGTPSVSLGLIPYDSCVVGVKAISFERLKSLYR